MTDESVKVDAVNMVIAWEMRNVALQAAHKITTETTAYWQKRATEAEFRLERRWSKRSKRAKLWATLAVLYGVVCAMAAISGWWR